jgi:glycosyltransferase involved in cell wall biosynthesis
MKDTFPLCSVIVPVYNHEHWLRECLDSVCLQTYPRIELIVIDDCSSDGSFEAAKSITSSSTYSRRFERIVCERTTVNSGAHAALNIGMGRTRGSYLFFLNSDDRFHPARLSRMVAHMRETGKGFAFSAVTPLMMPGSEIPAQLLEGLAAIEHRVPFLPSLSFAFLQFNHTVTTGNFAIRRDLAEQVGPFADLKLTHDWDYVLRTIIHEEPSYVADALYGYRLHPANTFRTVADRALIETEACLRRYLSQVAVTVPSNRLAPCEINWPGTFTEYLRIWHLEDVWDQINRASVRGGRTQAA